MYVYTFHGHCPGFPSVFTLWQVDDVMHFAPESSPVELDTELAVKLMNVLLEANALFLHSVKFATEVSTLLSKHL